MQSNSPATIQPANSTQPVKEIKQKENKNVDNELLVKLASHLELIDYPERILARFLHESLLKNASLDCFSTLLGQIFNKKEDMLLNVFFAKIDTQGKESCLLVEAHKKEKAYYEECMSYLFKNPRIKSTDLIKKMLLTSYVDENFFLNYIRSIVKGGDLFEHAFSWIEFQLAQPNEIYSEIRKVKQLSDNSLIRLVPPKKKGGYRALLIDFLSHEAQEFNHNNLSEYAIHLNNLLTILSKFAPELFKENLLHLAEECKLPAELYFIFHSHHFYLADSIFSVAEQMLVRLNQDFTIQHYRNAANHRSRLEYKFESKENSGKNPLEMAIVALSSSQEPFLIEFIHFVIFDQPEFVTTNPLLKLFEAFCHMDFDGEKAETLIYIDAILDRMFRLFLSEPKNYLASLNKHAITALLNKFWEFYDANYWLRFPDKDKKEITLYRNLLKNLIALTPDKLHKNLYHDLINKSCDHGVILDVVLTFIEFGKGHYQDEIKGLCLKLFHLIYFSRNSCLTIKELENIFSFFRSLGSNLSEERQDINLFSGSLLLRNINIFEYLAILFKNSYNSDINKAIEFLRIVEPDKIEDAFKTFSTKMQLVPNQPPFTETKSNSGSEEYLDQLFYLTCFHAEQDSKLLKQCLLTLLLVFFEKGSGLKEGFIFQKIQKALKGKVDFFTPDDSNFIDLLLKRLNLLHTSEPCQYSRITLILFSQHGNAAFRKAFLSRFIDTRDLNRQFFSILNFFDPKDYQENLSKLLLKVIPQYLALDLQFDSIKKAIDILVGQKFKSDGVMDMNTIPPSQVVYKNINIFEYLVITQASHKSNYIIEIFRKYYKDEMNLAIKTVKEKYSHLSSEAIHERAYHAAASANAILLKTICLERFYKQQMDVISEAYRISLELDPKIAKYQEQLAELKIRKKFPNHPKELSTSLIKKQVIRFFCDEDSLTQEALYVRDTRSAPSAFNFKVERDFLNNPYKTLKRFIFKLICLDRKQDDVNAQMNTEEVIIYLYKFIECAIHSGKDQDNAFEQLALSIQTCLRGNNYNGLADDQKTDNPTCLSGAFVRILKDFSDFLFLNNLQDLIPDWTPFETSITAGTLHMWFTQFCSNQFNLLATDKKNSLTDDIISKLAGQTVNSTTPMPESKELHAFLQSCEKPFIAQHPTYFTETKKLDHLHDLLNSFYLHPLGGSVLIHFSNIFEFVKKRQTQPQLAKLSLLATIKDTTEEKHEFKREFKTG